MNVRIRICSKHKCEESIIEFENGIFINQVVAKKVLEFQISCNGVPIFLS